jgi:hypothetical protein
MSERKPQNEGTVGIVRISQFRNKVAADRDNTDATGGGIDGI